MFAAFSALKEAGVDPRGATVAVQGFGKVGGAGGAVPARRRLHGRRGLRRRRRRRTTRSGLDTAGLLRHVRGGAQTVVGYPGTDRDHQRRAARAATCDILVPAALEGVLHEDNAAQVRARFVVEGANGPTTPDADDILADNGVLVVPDVLANSGGVAVSYFEWVQDLQAYFWSEDEVNDRLQALMERAYGQVVGAGRRAEGVDADRGADDRRRPGGRGAPHPRACIPDRTPETARRAGRVLSVATCLNGSESLFVPPRRKRDRGRRRSTDPVGRPDRRRRAG